MAVEVVSLIDVLPERVVDEVRELVEANASILVNRDLAPVVAKYASEREVALGALVHMRGASIEGSAFAYAFLEGERIKGLGTIIPNFRVERRGLWFNASGGFPVKFGRAAIAGLGPNIAGWYDQNNMAGLETVYRTLYQKARDTFADLPMPFVIEPVRSPELVHAAITTIPVDTAGRARYFAGQGLVVPPKSVLYRGYKQLS